VRVLVLTAGIGSRLDPITRLLAKPAVPLAGRRLVERVLAGLAAQGVHDVVLNLHYKPDTITSVVGDGAQLGLRVRYSWEMPLLGSAGGPRHALALLDPAEFAIVNGDTLCEVDLGALLDAHRARGADVTLAVIPNPAPDRYNGLTLDSAGRVTGVVPRGSPARDNWHFVGVQIARSDVFATLSDGVPAESVHGLYQGLLGRAAGGLWAHRVQTPFVDVGTPEDYLSAARGLARGPNAIEAGAEVSASASVRGCIVWPGASIGDRASLQDCIVTDVTVPAGFRATRSVLVPSRVAREGERSSAAAGIMLFPIESAN
jgi:NDP-sugar pyrophosphorylase family protein